MILERKMINHTIEFMIKEENIRVTVTLTPEHQRFLLLIMSMSDIKTFGGAIRKILDINIRDIQKLSKKE